MFGFMGVVVPRLPVETSAFDDVTPMETLAMDIARVHEGQTYGGTNLDVIEHHIKPAVGVVRRLGYGACCRSVVWLHDTVEDTDMTLREIQRRGMPLFVVYAVDLLTKRDDEPYEKSIERIVDSGHPCAIVAKTADSLVNGSNTILHPSANGDVDGKRIHRYPNNISVLWPKLPPKDHDAEAWFAKQNRDVQGLLAA